MVRMLDKGVPIFLQQYTVVRNVEQLLNGIIMDGKLAVLFWLMSLTNGEVTTDGFNTNRYDAGDRMVASTGALSSGGRELGQEVRLTYMFDQFMGRFNPTVDLSITDEGGIFAGVGLYQQFDMHIGDQDFFAGLTFTPGLYIQGDEIDLGAPLEFRSGVELGMRLDNDWQISLSYDHRSNGDFADVNPGMETIQLRLSKSFR